VLELPYELEVGRAVVGPVEDMEFFLFEADATKAVDAVNTINAVEEES
jgi:hypothetical protein